MPSLSRQSSVETPLSMWFLLVSSY
jgi:hypothetical protein